MRRRQADLARQSREGPAHKSGPRSFTSLWRPFSHRRGARVLRFAGWGMASDLRVSRDGGTPSGLNER